MTYARATDANQAEIVKVFRQLGCSVESLHRVGGGVPDLLVGFCGFTMLVEVKDGEKKRNHLTPDQIVFHDEWRGHPVQIVTCTADAVRILNYWRAWINRAKALVEKS